MKQNGLLVIALAIISSLHLSAQCDSVLTTTTDKFTKKTSIVSEIIDWTNADKRIGFRLFITPAEGGLPAEGLLVIVPNVTGCIDESAEVIFLLDDSSSVKMKSVSGYNCTPKASVIFYGKKKWVENLQKLSAHKITAIRLTLYSTYFDYDLTKDQSEELQEILSCGLTKLQSL